MKVTGEVLDWHEGREGDVRARRAGQAVKARGAGGVNAAREMT